MYHFRTNPPSRHVAPTPAFVRTYFPLCHAGDIQDTPRCQPDTGRNRALIARIAAFCDRNQIGYSRFGRQYAGDARLVESLQRGRIMGPNLASRIEAALSGSLHHA